MIEPAQLHNDLWVCFDTETTGLVLNPLVPIDRQPRVTEFAGILAEVRADGSGETIRELDFLCDPGVKLPAEVVKATGITQEMVTGKPTWAEYAADVANLFSGDPVLTPSDDNVMPPGQVGHNLMFDVAILKLEAKRLNGFHAHHPGIRMVCTVESAQHIRGHRLNLTALHEHLFGEGFGTAHRAINDARATLRCFREIRKRGIV